MMPCTTYKRWVCVSAGGLEGLRHKFDSHWPDIHLGLLWTDRVCPHVPVRHALPIITIIPNPQKSYWIQSSWFSPFRLIPPLNQLDLLRNLKNKSGLSFRSVRRHSCHSAVQKQHLKLRAALLIISFRWSEFVDFLSSFGFCIHGSWKLLKWFNLSVIF